MKGILRREGATTRILGNFFKSVVQHVLLFGAETWVVTPNMERALSAFLHGAARRLTGRQPRREKDGEWQYPSLEGGMEEAGLTDIHTSIPRSQNTVAQYIATRPLLDLCVGARAREGAKVTLRWWEQAGIDWEKAKAKGTVKEMTAGTETGTDTEGEEEWDEESRASGSIGAEWSGASADGWT